MYSEQYGSAWNYWWPHGTDYDAYDSQSQFNPLCTPLLGERDGPTSPYNHALPHEMRRASRIDKKAYLREASLPPEWSLTRWWTL